MKKFTSAYLFQIAQDKSCDYLLIKYMKKFEMVKQKKRTRITQSGKNCAMRDLMRINFTIAYIQYSLSNLCSAKLSLVIAQEGFVSVAARRHEFITFV